MLKRSQQHCRTSDRYEKNFKLLETSSVRDFTHFISLYEHKCIRIPINSLNEGLCIEVIWSFRTLPAK